MASIHYSDGKVLGPASKSVEANVATWDLTKVFAGDPDNVAWIDDVKLDRDGLSPPALLGEERRTRYAR